jgi:hypothetical protein
MGTTESANTLKHFRCQIVELTCYGVPGSVFHHWRVADLALLDFGAAGKSGFEEYVTEILLDPAFDVAPG